MPESKFCERCGRKLVIGPWSVKRYSGFSGEPVEWMRHVVCPLQLNPLAFLWPWWSNGHTDRTEYTDTTTRTVE